MKDENGNKVKVVCALDPNCKLIDQCEEISDEFLEKDRVIHEEFSEKDRKLHEVYDDKKQELCPHSPKHEKVLYPSFSVQLETPTEENTKKNSQFVS